MNNFTTTTRELELDTCAGAHIYGCNKEAQELANLLMIPVSFKFNGEKQVIYPTYKK